MPTFTALSCPGMAFQAICTTSGCSTWAAPTASAFEFERPGGRVTAADIDSTRDLDLPLPARLLAAARGYDDPLGDGFALAHRLLKSNVERVTGTIYDLDPDRAASTWSTRATSSSTSGTRAGPSSRSGE